MSTDDRAMAAPLEFDLVPTAIDRAVEIVPPRWIDDDELIELEQRYAYRLLLIERFADGTLLVTPPAGWRSSSGNVDLMLQLGNWARTGNHGFVQSRDCLYAPS